MATNDLYRDTDMDVRSMVEQRQHQQSQDNYQHGDYVVGNDGVAGIYIDKQEVIRRETETPQIKMINEKLREMDSQIEHMTTRNDERAILSKVNPNNPETADIAKVAEAFAAFDMTANGLAPNGSTEIEQYKRNIELYNSRDVSRDDDVLKNAQMVQPVQNVPMENPTYEAQQPVDNHTDTVVKDTSPDIVQFNVKSENVKDFMGSLTDDELSKVQRTNTIVVNEIKEIDIPVATRTITSLDEFKRILPKQSHSDTIETVLINSGYAATFKGCGALAMATLVPNSENEPIDYGKQYNFIYENLVTTSIGKMSYNEFCARTHINDLSTCLLAILRASDPDENSVVLECADCKTSYEIKYRLSELLDVDSITDEMSEQIDKIVSTKHTYEDALATHMASPVMTVKYAQVTVEDCRYTIEFKPANGSTIIERVPIIRKISEQYSAYVAGVVTYVPKITVEILSNGQKFDVIDPMAIAEILSIFDVSTTRGLGKILSSITEYPSPKYSFKGSYVCPKCQRKENNVPCTIESLVFYRVGMAMQ